MNIGANSASHQSCERKVSDSRPGFRVAIRRGPDPLARQLRIPFHYHSTQDIEARWCGQRLHVEKQCDSGFHREQIVESQGSRNGHVCWPQPVSADPWLCKSRVPVPAESGKERVSEWAGRRRDETRGARVRLGLSLVVCASLRLGQPVDWIGSSAIRVCCYIRRGLVRASAANV
jgi:hypothetical protein